MSKMLCLKLREDIYEETESITKKMRIPRNSYLNAAVELYNKLKKRSLLKRELAKESAALREDTLEVLEIFDALEDEITEN